jgi:hypothetical protein
VKTEKKCALVFSSKSHRFENEGGSESVKFAKK